MSDDSDNLGEVVPESRPTGRHAPIHVGLNAGDWIKLLGVIIAAVGLVCAGAGFAFYPRANAATLETTVRLHIEAQVRSDEKLDRFMAATTSKLDALTGAVQALKPDKRKRGDHE